jgi:hypothetical protein
VTSPRNQRGTDMTDTTTATPAEANGTDQAVGTLEYLDPIMLEIGDNVRDDAALSKEFLASIAENGVLVPITGVRHPDNSDVIRVRPAPHARGPRSRPDHRPGVRPAVERRRRQRRNHRADRAPNRHQRPKARPHRRAARTGYPADDRCGPISDEGRQNSPD